MVSGGAKPGLKRLTVRLLKKKVTEYAENDQQADHNETDAGFAGFLGTVVAKNALRHKILLS